MLYEYTEFHMTIFMLIGPIFIIASLIIWWSIKSRNAFKTIGVFLFATIGLLITVHNFSSFYDLMQNVVKEYEQGNYLIVEGNVVPIDMDNIPNGSDEFEVNGIVFEIGDNTKPGLQIKAYYGGPISANNQTVKIWYVTYKDENYIMKLEILESDE